MEPGLIAAIAGSLMGITGGLLGTYASLSNAKTDEERRFLIWASIALWSGILLFIVLLMVTPLTFRWMIWGIYALTLPIAIRLINRRQERLRGELGPPKEKPQSA